MEIKTVTKRLILFFIFLGITNSILSQNRVRYLLFNKIKDSIVNIQNKKYYKIDKNLFNLNRYNEIDTISLKEMQTISAHSPKELIKEGASIVDLLIKKNYKTNKFVIIEETNNYYFEYIYILEKISASKFKKTRVWWEDIIGCSG
ncbi:hypothetical protein LNI90_11695 [Tenacibaculum dicentrarchi]|nr:hypothetical protein [Tenacibaculum dicentrarchi]MCG8829029.1 hypothetical protein [Tenacibaculum dicentrarchi]MCG8838949.1 hypothetical protein [Tenacibaculum dicentrarchi]WBX67987.1 hypothetical protein PG910_07585 [Tenacibaculum dicentrarchi]